SRCLRRLAWADWYCVYSTSDQIPALSRNAMTPSTGLQARISRVPSVTQIGAMSLVPQLKASESRNGLVLESQCWASDASSRSVNDPTQRGSLNAVAPKL